MGFQIQIGFTNPNIRRTGKRLAAVGLIMILGTLITASPTLAQDGMPWRVAGPVESYDFARAVAGGGDMNGDGFGDVVAAGPYFDLGGGVWAPVVCAYDGRDGSLLWMITTNPEEGSLYIDTVFLSDVNGDGRDDVAVGFQYPARIGVFSGLDGSLIYERFGETPENDWMGLDLAVIRDVDDDGISDLATVSLYAEAGTVSILSGRTGETIREIPAAWPRRVGRAGDLDNDGYDEVLIGGSYAGGLYGTVVHSSRTGVLVYDYRDYFVETGYMFDGGRDVTGDGISDFFLSNHNSGQSVFSGADGLLVRWTSRGGELWAAWCDVDGDGQSEIASDELPTSITCINWQNDERKRQFALGRYGAYTSYGNQRAVADLNHDGCDDLIVGDSDKNEVLVYAGSPLGLNIPNDNSYYTIEFVDIQRGAEFSLRTADANADGGTVYFLYSARGNGCTWHSRLGDCIDLTQPIQVVGTVAADETGVAELTITVPADAPLRPVWFQSIQLRHNGPRPALSNVLQAQIVE